jgi:hypothetical protein
MRKKTVILMSLLLLCGVLWLTHVPPFLENPAETVPEIRGIPRLSLTSSVSFTEPGTGFSKIPVLSGPLPELTAAADSRENGRTLLVRKKLTEWMADKEGSYTNLNELFQSGGTFSFDVHSGWVTDYLLPDHNLPSFRVRIIKNPETGEYEPVGGVLTLPGLPLEAGYETDPVTDENKATLQWKKSF